MPMPALLYLRQKRPHGFGADKQSAKVPEKQRNRRRKNINKDNLIAETLFILQTSATID